MRTRYLTTRVILCLLLLFTATAQAQTEEDNACCGAGAFNEGDILTQDGARISATCMRAVSMPEDTSLPEKFDWRNVDGDNWMTPVEIQGCNDCCAFSATGAIEPAVKRHMNDPTLNIDLSEQYLVSECCSAMSCAGGYLDRVMECTKKGIPFEKDFPYQGVFSKCSPFFGWENDSWRVVDYIHVNKTDEDIKWALIEYGPLSVAYGGHAVVLVGYDDAEGCWIIKDSSKSDPGYKKVSYGNSYDAFAITSVSREIGAWEKPTIAIASSYSDENHSPEKAIDDNQRTTWWSNRHESDPWMQFDMGEKRPISKIRMMVFPTIVPLTVDVQVSNDALDWETVTAAAVVKEGNNFCTIPFDQTTVTTRYVRVVETSFDGDHGACVELDVFISDEDEGEFVNPIWARASSYDGYYSSGMMALDGNPNTHWTSGRADNTTKHWIFVKLADGGKVVNGINGVQLTISPYYLPMVVEVQTNDYFVAITSRWETAVSNFTITKEMGGTVFIPFSPTDASYIKVTQRHPWGRTGDDRDCYGTMAEFCVHKE